MFTDGDGLRFPFVRARGSKLLHLIFPQHAGGRLRLVFGKRSGAEWLLREIRALSTRLGEPCAQVVDRPSSGHGSGGGSCDGEKPKKCQGYKDDGVTREVVHERFALQEGVMIALAFRLREEPGEDGW